MNVGGEEGRDAKDDDEELYRDININLEGRDILMTYVHTTQEFKDTHVTLTLVNPGGQQQSSAVFSIPEIVERYMDQRMNKAVKVGVQLQSDMLRDETQAENEDFINKLDEN
nr:hypothetical protein [Tanacetum cinerariifolium]